MLVVVRVFAEHVEALEPQAIGLVGDVEQTAAAKGAFGSLVRPQPLEPAFDGGLLGELNRAGLVSSRQDGRFVIYAADYRAMDALVAFLNENCCTEGGC